MSCRERRRSCAAPAGASKGTRRRSIVNATSVGGNSLVELLDEPEHDGARVSMDAESLQKVFALVKFNSYEYNDCLSYVILHRTV